MAQIIDTAGVLGKIRDKELLAEVSKKMSAELLRLAKAVQRDAVSTAREHKISGRLASGISSGRAKQGSKFSGTERTVVFVRSDAPESLPFEYGTSERQQKTTGRETGAMPKIGLIWPAFDRNKGAFLRRIRGLIR